MDWAWEREESFPRKGSPIKQGCVWSISGRGILTAHAMAEGIMPPNTLLSHHEISGRGV